jgi:SAM-dependent methyltransferase
LTELDALLARADALCSDDAFRDVVWRLCTHRERDVEIDRLNTRIHRNDQMLLHSLNYFREVNWSLSQYFNVALQQHNAAQQILRCIFGEPGSDFHILDFACGYGRLIRFLTLSVPPSRVWASDIQSDAVDFVTRQFGVRGVPSHVDPERFDPGRRFHFIWAASLFSHLPRTLFQGWLRRLTSLLEPGGILCFSARDERLLPPQWPMPPDGFRYDTVSENAELDTSVYGTTWVTEAYVRRAIAAVAGPNYDCWRLARGLANEQDIYITGRNPPRGLESLSRFRQGAWGWIDECRVSDDGELYLRGWAASLDDGAIEAVTVTLDGETHRCPTGLESDDVRRVLQDERLGFCDWEFRHKLVQRTTPAFLEVTATAAANETALLYAGRIAAPQSSEM